MVGSLEFRVADEGFAIFAPVLGLRVRQHEAIQVDSSGVHLPLISNIRTS